MVIVHLATLLRAFDRSLRAFARRSRGVSHALPAILFLIVMPNAALAQDKGTLDPTLLLSTGQSQ
jgi:hypothetical protein